MAPPETPKAASAGESFPLGYFVDKLKVNFGNVIEKTLAVVLEPSYGPTRRFGKVKGDASFYLTNRLSTL
jgi:hypothetical protein